MEDTMPELPQTAAIALTLALSAGPATAQELFTATGDMEGPLVLVIMDFETVQMNPEGGSNQGSSGQTAQPGDSPTDTVSVDGVLDNAAGAPLVRLVVNDHPGEGTSVNGMLVFTDIAGLTAWRGSEMEDFFAPLGGMDMVETTIRIVDRGRLAEYGLGTSDTPLENLTITYVNEGNESDGDADIDAVTVVCPGDFADCSPSN
jgi:hypothetical protein